MGSFNSFKTKMLRRLRSASVGDGEGFSKNFTAAIRGK